jgi:co-chaperonin GroES (HSP10)
VSSDIKTAADIYLRNRQEAMKYKHLIEPDEENNCVVINKSLVLDIVIGDNIIILEDQYKSGYECKDCRGLGERELKCLKCDGYDKECGRCDGKGFRVERCKLCNGKGVSIEIPDDAKARPTSGTIVAIGPEVQYYALGNRVAYSTYTGHLLPFKGNNRLRIMKESEPFCRIRDIKTDNADAVPVEFIDTDDPYLPTTL